MNEKNHTLAGMSFIWDLDGTLIDSYPVLIGSLQKTLSGYGILQTEEELREYALRYSVRSYLEKTAAETGIPFAQLKSRYSALTRERISGNRLMPGAKEALRDLQERGGVHFLYTHKGTSSFDILDMLGIRSFFRDIVTGADGFPRKPAPDAVRHLMERHGLRPENTWYVGDRKLDRDCAENAGIGSIFYISSEVGEQEAEGADLIVRDLREIAEKVGDLRKRPGKKI